MPLIHIGFGLERIDNHPLWLAILTDLWHRRRQPHILQRVVIARRLHVFTPRRADIHQLQDHLRLLIFIDLRNRRRRPHPTRVRVRMRRKRLTGLEDVGDGLMDKVLDTAAVILGHNDRV